ncbi:MAG: RNA polymerase sigma-70 factor ECF subfamily [Fusobacteria bacterium]|nr:MAG: RNA polymerase sigma-70 factor ECF subfamily [Fusobacteriota bacterium]KAF0229167.1 MAG: RNA polymerase sigma-70 factor ECF [Fusobacteriota bacterium]
MDKSFDDDISNTIEKYGDMVRRISFLYFRNMADVEDVFQEVFLQYFLNIDKFQSEEHKKSWLCRVTFNKCKDLIKSFWRKKVISLEKVEIAFESEEQSELMAAVLKLPTDYKNIIYMHYYEGFTVPEIAEVTKKNINTVYSLLRRAKVKLKKELGEIEL